MANAPATGAPTTGGPTTGAPATGGPTTAAPMVAVRDLAVTFGHGRGQVAAVAGVSFTVAAGEAFGLVGESGSGKTTVLRAVAGLTGLRTGRVAVAGKEQKALGAKGLARTLQMVFQDPYGSLHPRYTVDRILSEPLAIHRLGDTARPVAAALAGVGLGPAFRFRYPHQLSGGQRQRIAIARALILGPRILALDEPTSALDVSVQAEILNLLNRLRGERRLTYLLVSHDLAVVAHMCDRLGVMNEGRIVEELTAAELRAGKARDPYTRRLLGRPQRARVPRP
jgi:peptide/nickel transport system ATP-binding protein